MRNQLSTRNTLVGRRAFLGAAFLAATLAPTASGQACFGPDNLSGPCWQPTQANLPSFPAFDLPALGLCWKDCTLAGEELAKIEVGAPVFNLCGQYRAPVTVIDSTGAPVLVGDMIMDYTRTWDEVAPFAPAPVQVWRFAVKIDFGSSTPSATAPCYVPAEHAAGLKSFWYGYVDYAHTCTPDGFKESLVLFNNCDRFTHKPGFADVPGVFNPDSTRAIVAPHTAVNPFAPVVTLPPAGPAALEAVRNAADPLLGGTCITEERLSAASVQTLGQGCLCPPAAAGNLFAQRMKGVGTCGVPGAAGGSSFDTLNLFPFAPWFNVMTTSLGRWTSPATYPGDETVSVNEGLFLYTDSCAIATGLPATSFDIFYGASTDEGYPVLGPAGTFVTRKFVDLASNFSADITLPVVFPVLGSVRPTKHLIYLNPE